VVALVAVVVSAALRVCVCFGVVWVYGGVGGWGEALVEIATE